MPKSEDEIRAQIEADRESLIYYLGRMHGGMDTLEESPGSPEPPPASRPNYRRPPPPPSLRNQRGGIQKAVLEVLRNAPHPLTMAEIHKKSLPYIGDVGREPIRHAVYRVVDRGLVTKHGNTFFISPSGYEQSLSPDDEDG